MKICGKCVLPETYPGIEFDENGTCNVCNTFEAGEKNRSNHHFKNERELMTCLEKYKNTGGKYDVLVPLSGGVDSCNALITIVETYGMKALGFHNDQGYEDEIATANARELCKKLNVNLVIVQQDIGFMRKLYRYINEADARGLNSCYVCGNILYINALEMADRYHIPLVINGYSKGQAVQVNDVDKGIELFEMLLEVVGRTGDKEFIREFMDKYKILEKRFAYRSKRDLEKDVDLEKILFIPFYVFDFYKIDKDRLKEKIKKCFYWKPQKTTYPARTTNCEMIWLNTYMDLQKMGYSNYHIEYSELIRRGEITREQALQDLEFKPPQGIVQRLAKETGVDINKFKEKNTRKEEKPAGKKVEIEFDF